MDWPVVMALMFGALIALMLTGMPIAFSFLLTCIIGALLFWGGSVGLYQLAMGVFSSVTNFSLLPVPLFILMGNIIFASGIGARVVEAIDKLLGRMPGRLSILTIASGTVLGAMIGISGGSISVLGRTLLPEMVRRGYDRSLTLGPIVGTGILAIMIPPSALAVFLAAMGGTSAGDLLIAIVLPGLTIAALSIGYIVLRCLFNPALAPPYEVQTISPHEKLVVVFRDLLPLAFIIFSVTGVIFLGICTPSEAAALGALACYLLAACYKRLTWEVIKESAVATIEITAMIFAIVIGAMIFSRILASSGAVQGLIHLLSGGTISRWAVLLGTQAVALLLGCFMDPASIVMLTAPIFVPLVSALGFDPLWYSVILLLNIQLGLITPPLGLDVYTIKAVAASIDPEATLEDAFRSSMPFFAIGLVVMILIMVFPSLALWLPSLTK
ncbi:MAG: TRAP transporter large permease [Moorellales bacterium]